MSDYNESGAEPVEDAAVSDPPTIDEVLAERDRDESNATSDRVDEGPADASHRASIDNPLAAEDDDD